MIVRTLLAALALVIAACGDASVTTTTASSPVDDGTTTSTTSSSTEEPPPAAAAAVEAYIAALVANDPGGMAAVSVRAAADYASYLGDLQAAGVELSSKQVVSQPTIGLEERSGVSVRLAGEWVVDFGTGDHQSLSQFVVSLDGTEAFVDDFVRGDASMSSMVQAGPPAVLDEDGIHVELGHVFWQGDGSTLNATVRIFNERAETVAIDALYTAFTARSTDEAHAAGQVAGDELPPGEESTAVIAFGNVSAASAGGSIILEILDPATLQNWQFELDVPAWG